MVAPFLLKGIAMSLLTKYKPQNLNDLVIPNTAIKDLLDDMANGYVINKLCFVGTNGTGKSTAAHLMPALIEGFPPSTVHLIGEEKFDVNNAINQLSTINNFGWSDQKYQYVLFDELDKVKNNLAALWQTMDKFNDKVIVIATANDFMKIEKAVRSRFQLLDFGLITADDFLPRAQQILGLENIDLKDSYVLSQLQTKQSLSDMRKYFDTLSDIQRNHNAGRIHQDHYV